MQGSATDAEDGRLPTGSLSWNVVRRHAQHTHPFQGANGNNITFEAPGPENLSAAADSGLLVILTATDSQGLRSTTSRVLLPHKVDITLATAPVGRQVTVNGEVFTGPTTVTSWEGYPLQLAIADQTAADGQGYKFTSWSDGSAAAHSFTTPSTAKTVTASFAPAAGPGVPTAFMAKQSGGGVARMTWAPPASNGGAAISGYRVSRDGTDSTGDGPYNTTVSAATRTFSMKRLVKGRTYRLSVSTITATATGPAVGGPVKINTWAKPPVPTGFTVKQTGGGAATMTWLPPVGANLLSITAYQVTRNGTDTAGKAAGTTTLPATARTFTMKRLAPGSTYTLSVKAMNAAGSGRYVGGPVKIT